MFMKQVELTEEKDIPVREIMKVKRQYIYQTSTEKQEKNETESLASPSETLQFT